MLQGGVKIHDEQLSKYTNDLNIARYHHPNWEIRSLNIVGYCIVLQF